MSTLYGWLSTEPPVLVHSSHEEDIGKHLPEDPIIRFVSNMWHSSASHIADYHRRAQALRPDHVIQHLVNEPDICRELIAQGIPAHFINYNAFLDERIFSIRLETEKRFDAVYNARMSSFKRHSLAAEIPQLLVIGGIVTDDDSTEYFRNLIEAMPNATFLQAEDGRIRSGDEVATKLSESRVGLCLSAREGAMFACTEYLLCGLPVVSTVSQGGRDVWLDPRFTRIVAEDPKAIAAAVLELSARKISPHFVRNETLARIVEHRRRFVDLGQTVYTAMHAGRDFARDFYANFTNKLGNWRPNHEVMKWYEQQRQR